MPRNRLGGETSPYLLQHRDNPVHWRPWNAAALAEARKSNKPILLSIGYSACHWCHVMAHESFEDGETAALMNELFVNIKVDREERPDLDAIYQTALALLGQQGGWPLTMFLTPGGEPFWGATYFPPTRRYGRPGFREVLRAVHNVYLRQPEQVEHNRAAVAEALRQLSKKPAGDGLATGHLDASARLLLAEIDPLHGGVGGAPKFPQVMTCELMWRAYCRSGDGDLRDAVLLTARHVCEGGIYDHLGGGFARYATDERWLVPHFEKMLYDNALIIDLLALLWQETREPLFRTRTEETVGWLGREMMAPDGGFASALDADSEGEEGKFYTWAAAEIDELLGTDAERFKRAYDVRPDGNWEGRNVLHRNHPAAADFAVDDAALSSAREALFRERAARVPPGRDDKVLADWNGLMIAALANAGAVFEHDEWITAAADAFAFVSTHMTRDGRLRHSYCAGRPGGSALLDDYANMARAAIALYEVTGDTAYLAQAEAWVAVADRHYWDDADGGYLLTADDAETLIVRTKTAIDSATPSANATMVGVLARLYALTAKAAYRERADAVVAVFSRDASQNPLGLSALVNAHDTLRATVQVVIVGHPDDAATRRLSRAVFDTNAPNRVLARIAPDAALPEGHPAADKGLANGRPAAYVCVGETCSLPITEGDGLRAALASP